MRAFLCILFGLSGGLVVGGGIVAFFTVLGVVSNIIKFTETEEYSKVAEWAVLIGALTASIFYFFDIKLSLGKFIPIIGALFAGIFIGIVASALAETLDVMPVIADRLDILNWIYVGVFSIMIGKIFFSTIYWLTIGFAN